MGLVMKCKKCGVVCTNEYYQLTRRHKLKCDVVAILCPKCAGYEPEAKKEGGDK